MDKFTATALHEAAHAVVWQLEEAQLGPVTTISAIPDVNRAGHVLGDESGAAPPSPRRLRASGRMLAAGLLAEQLAGGDPPEAAGEGDERKLKLVKRLAKGDRYFIGRCKAGAELMLRIHWGAVEHLAAQLQSVGVMGPPYAESLTRMALERPLRPLAPGFDRLGLLLAWCGQLPEFAEPFEKVLRGMLPPAPPAKAARPPGTRPRRLSRSSRGARRVSGGAIG